MKRGLLALCLAMSILLSGCGFLNRSYTSEAPHQQFSDGDKNEDVLRAETYQGLVSALLFLVSQGKEEGVIRLYEYSGQAKEDLDTACLEVTQQDPLGAYAVDYMKYDLAQVMTYEEVNLKIVYKRSWEQISDVSTVTGSSAVLGELREVLADFQKEKVLRVSYFDESLAPESVVSMVEEAYFDVPEGAFGRPTVSVKLYPEQATSQQRLVEILMEYPEPRESLKARQAELLTKAKELTDPLRALPAEEKLSRIVMILKETVSLLPSGSGGATAYAALVEGKADEEGIALAAELLLQKSGLQCRIVKGSKQGKAHLWNIVQLEDEWQHLDLTTVQPTPSGDQSMKAAGYLWSGDIPVCQEILLEVPSPGNG